MLNVWDLSPQNEGALARQLESEIRRVWADVAADPHDRIDLLVGARSGVDVDFLIAIDLDTPHAMPPQRHAHARAPEPLVSCGLIAIEVKQLDAARFDRIGDQLFAIYAGKRSDRSVSDQARDAAYGIKNFAATSGFTDFYVHALAWLTQVGAASLDGVDPTIVGQSDWRSLLVAACAQNTSLSRDDERRRLAVRAVRDRLLLRRTLTPLDRSKTERIARDTIVRDIVSDLAPHAGTSMIRLAGHGGSGKTTALVLLATRLATQCGARVIVLTFHHALRGDIRHVFESMPEAQGLLGDKIHVETATSFLLALVAAAGGTVPLTAEGSIDYDRTDATFREVADSLGPHAAASDGASVVEEDRARFDWDHVLVDEAQDWTDAERDLLIAVYGSRRMVLADGLVQLIRRHTSCDWMRGVAKSERVVRHLGDSLRMQHNVAVYANAIARTLGFANWSVEPRRDLIGGRVVVLEGELDDAPALVRAFGAFAALGKADPVDNLICVPHSEIIRAPNGARHAKLAAELLANGDRVWDACDPMTRTSVPDHVDAWRIVQYDSCRGLEGWATLLLAIDDLYANRIKHPNVGAVEPVGIDPVTVAKRWLLIPLTRAVHLIVVHVRDPQSSVASMLREAASTLPKDAVEFFAACDGAARLQPSG